MIYVEVDSSDPFSFFLHSSFVVLIGLITCGSNPVVGSLVQSSFVV